MPHGVKLEFQRLCVFNQALGLQPKRHCKADDCPTPLEDHDSQHLKNYPMGAPHPAYHLMAETITYQRPAASLDPAKG